MQGPFFPTVWERGSKRKGWPLQAWWFLQAGEEVAGRQEAWFQALWSHSPTPAQPLDPRKQVSPWAF